MSLILAETDVMMYLLVSCNVGKSLLLSEPQLTESFIRFAYKSFTHNWIIYFLLLCGRVAVVHLSNIIHPLFAWCVCGWVCEMSLCIFSVILHQQTVCYEQPKKRARGNVFDTLDKYNKGNSSIQGNVLHNKRQRFFSNSIKRWHCVASALSCLGQACW